MAAVIIFVFILPAIFMYALYKATGEEEKSVDKTQTINFIVNLQGKQD